MADTEPTDPVPPVVLHRLYTVEQVADLLAVSVRLVFKFLADGQLRAVHPSPGVLRVRADDLDAFILAHTEEPDAHLPEPD